MDSNTPRVDFDLLIIIIMIRDEKDHRSEPKIRTGPPVRNPVRKFLKSSPIGFRTDSKKMAVFNLVIFVFFQAVFDFKKVPSSSLFDEDILQTMLRTH